LAILCNEFLAILGGLLNGGTASRANMRGALVSKDHMNTLKPKSPLPKLMFTVPEAAIMLSISEKTVYRLIKRGVLKAPAEVRTKLITTASIELFAGVTR